MTSLILRRALSLVVAAVLIAASSPAAAEWKRAESERFVVYSESSAPILREYVQNLETFDRVLRAFMGLPMSEAPPRKLPIYIVRNHRGLEAVWPTVPDQVGGFYLAGDEDIFAVATREAGGESIVLHEYAHHFMYQNFASAYPGWFTEGFAEYYATAEINGDRVNVGRPDENRGYWLLNSQWLPLEDLLSKRPGEIGRRQETYYPVAWLVTHWFLSDDVRRQQLAAYLADIQAGADPVEAMERAIGMDIAALTRVLRTYSRQALLYRRVDHPFPDAEIAIASLPRSADDLLLLNQRLKRGVEDEEKPALIAEVRRLAGRHPDDAFALRVLARAEILAGEPQRAEAILADLLEREPANVEALQLMARTVMIRADAESDIAPAEALQRRARAFLGRAFAADDANFVTFMMIAESRRTSRTYPNENDLHTLRLAQALAPQLETARLSLAAALLFRDEGREEALALLAPVANDPHGDGLAAQAQAMIDRANGVPISRAELDAADAAGDPEAEPETP